MSVGSGGWGGEEKSVMVSSGGISDGGRSKEAAGMMALHEALRTVCLNSDWTYSVFWTIRHRPRMRGGNGCKVGDDHGSLMLMWEDGFCRGRVGGCLEEMDGEDPVRKAFSKMSIQLYNYGEGLMGKVASDKCHKWVFKEPPECEPNMSNYWQSSFDALPPEWADQFESGVQTIAVIQAGHGLLQLGSCKVIPEDLHFVLRMRHTFESLGYQSGFYLSQLFSSTRNCPSSSTPSRAMAIPMRPPAPLFSWGQRPPPSATSLLSSPGFQYPRRLGFPQPKNETLAFLRSHSSENQMDEMASESDIDIRWPNGLSFFNALTGRSEDVKLLFDHDGLPKKPDQGHMSPPFLDGKILNSDTLSMQQQDHTVPTLSKFLSLDSHRDGARKGDNKYKRSFTMPARMTPSSTSADQGQPQISADYRNSGAGMYPDMETFM